MSGTGLIGKPLCVICACHYKYNVESKGEKMVCSKCHGGTFHVAASLIIYPFERRRS